MYTVFFGIQCLQTKKSEYQLLIHREELKRMGMYDKATGMLNRNSYDEFIKEDVTNKDRNLTCVYIDINGLHKLNNEKGHDAGDHLIETVAKSLQNNFADGKNFRAGGDEFVIILEKISIETVEKRKEKVDREIGEYGYSVYWGIASRQGEFTNHELVQEADKIMLNNKSQNKSRNR